MVNMNVPETADHPVSVAVHRQIRPGHENQAERLFQAAIDAASTFPGHQGAFVLRHGGSSFTLVFRFASPSTLAAWEQSPERAELLRQFEDLTLRAEIQHQDGLEPFFNLPGGQPALAPPRWKMALVTWSVAFPLIQFYQALLGPFLKPLPRPIQGAFVGALMVSTMTWVAMPVATKTLRTWLFRR